MRTLAIALAFWLCPALASHAHAHMAAELCKDQVKLEELNKYVTDTTALVTKLEAVKDAKQVSIAQKLHEEITAIVETNVKLMKQCLELIARRQNQDPPPRPEPRPPPTITILGASYGDHQKQAACEAWAARTGAAGRRCTFACDATVNLRTTCGKATEIKHIIYVDKDSKTEIIKRPIKIDDKEVEPKAKDFQQMCVFTAGNSNCGKVDPSPDSPAKTLELTYSCSGQQGVKRIEALQGEQVAIDCRAR